MSDQNPQALPPEAQLMQLLFAKFAFFSLAAVARLKIADHMSATPLSVEHIARTSSTHSASLYRVLRLLASFGVFTEGPDHHFSLAPVGELLRTDNPHSMRDVAVMFTDPWQIESYGRLEDVIRTGTDAPTLIYGEHVFDYFAKHPAEAANFHRAMTGFSASATEALLEVADFSPFHRVADCGGGHGFVLSRILDRFPNLIGVLYDLPEVVAGAPAAGHLSRAEGRYIVEAGSFFERVPEGCDAYLMKHILHDWDDESSRTVLTLMRDRLKATAPETGRVFLCEMVVPDTPEPAPAKLLDIEMLTVTRGGKERTHAEFARLFESAGLRLLRITPTKAPVCLIEAGI